MNKKLKMRIYVLHRNDELDHKHGRPAILLNQFADKSLVWTSTTINWKNKNSLEILLSNKKSKFYKHNIQTVETKDLLNEWIDKKTKKENILNSNQEKKLISQFVEFTNQQDPYKYIDELKKTIKVLKNEIVILKKENQHLKTKTLNVKDIEQEFEI